MVIRNGLTVVNTHQSIQEQNEIHQKSLRNLRPHIEIEAGKEVAEPNKKILKAAQELEGLFLTYLFKAMEKTIPESALFGSKNNLAGMMFSSVMGQAIANQGGIGLSEMIVPHLSEIDYDELGNPLNSISQLSPAVQRDLIYNLRLLEENNE